MQIGFSFDTQNSGSDSASMLNGDKKLRIMLFGESTFKNFTGNEIADTKKGTEVLFSVGADSREDVDENGKESS